MTCFAGFRADIKRGVGSALIAARRLLSRLGGSLLGMALRHEYE